jgi:membrane protein DedA with SNARE-associated domain/membrane-associated phospholipid phosphatase
MDTIEKVLSLLAEYGYWIVLFGVMLESAGVPIPGETILLASGVLAQQGRLDVEDAILFGALGAVIGDQIGYLVGREGGRPFVLRWGRYVLITPERLARAEKFFERHGGKAVFMARFVAGLRVFGALVAGIGRTRWHTFFFYNVLGGATWATTVVLAGYLLGGSLDLAERWMGRVSALLVILLVVGLVLYLAYRWISNHPEQSKRVYARIGGEYLNALLQSPAGLWLRRRFDPGEVYGLALTVGLLFTGLFSWAFGSIVQDVLSRDPLVDLAVLRFVYSHRDPTLTTGVTVFEAVFSPEAVLLAGATVGGLLVVLGRRRREAGKLFSGVVLLATAFGTGILVELFKFLFNRPRPPASLQLVAETGLSFPSGHAMAALVVGVAVLYVWSLRAPERRGGSWRAKVRTGLIIFTLALLVGLGRVYTGAHYPSDVLAGWALGGVWASLCLTAAEVLRRSQKSKSEGRDG